MEGHEFERVFSLFSRLALATIAVSACSGERGPFDTERGRGAADLTALCADIRDHIVVGAPKDGIESLTNPELVDPNSPFVDYLQPTDRVIGLEVNGEYLAVPHNILWWHEIANFDDLGLTVTYCPLTGSSMVFERSNANNAEFAVSGLLYRNNLVMFDRNADPNDNTLFPQMLAGAFCGPLEGLELAMYAAIEIEWEDWVALHPDTRVVSDRTGRGNPYTLYPYGQYEVEDNPHTLYAVEELDTRRLPKERVLGILSRSGRGIAFPFGSLRDAAVGDRTVVHVFLGDENGQGAVDPMVVFWDGEAAAAMAFHPKTPTRDLTFEVNNGAIVDLETGSAWSVDGVAVSGPLLGERLLSRPDAYVSFWFAFTQIFKDPVLWIP